MKTLRKLFLFGMQHTNLLWIVLIVVVASVGCNLNRAESSGNKIVAATVQEGWTITVIGEVTRLHKINVDKSGRHPKYMVQIQMKVESVDDAGAGIELESPILLQGRETEVVNYLKRLPTVGERLVVQSYGLEKRPRLLSINGAKFAIPK